MEDRYALEPGTRVKEILAHYGISVIPNHDNQEVTLSRVKEGWPISLTLPNTEKTQGMNYFEKAYSDTLAEQVVRAADALDIEAFLLANPSARALASNWKENAWNLTAEFEARLDVAADKIAEEYGIERNGNMRGLDASIKEWAHDSMVFEDTLYCMLEDGPALAEAMSSDITFRDIMDGKTTAQDIASKYLHKSIPAQMFTDAITASLNDRIRNDKVLAAQKLENDVLNRCEELAKYEQMDLDPNPTFPAYPTLSTAINNIPIKIDLPTFNPETPTALAEKIIMAADAFEPIIFAKSSLSMFPEEDALDLAKFVGQRLDRMAGTLSKDFDLPRHPELQGLDVPIGDWMKAADPNMYKNLTVNKDATIDVHMMFTLDAFTFRDCIDVKTPIAGIQDVIDARVERDKHAREIATKVIDHALSGQRMYVDNHSSTKDSAYEKAYVVEADVSPTSQIYVRLLPDERGRSAQHADPLNLAKRIINTADHYDPRTFCKDEQFVMRSTSNEAFKRAFDIGRRLNNAADEISQRLHIPRATTRPMATLDYAQATKDRHAQNTQKPAQDKAKNRTRGDE